MVRLETRPPNLEGKGAIRQRELLVNGLRMRPDRIVVGEVRGEEALDMLQAMNTGHDGSLTTIHANTPRDALTRARDDDRRWPASTCRAIAIRQQISSAVHLVRADVALERRHAAGHQHLTEVTGMEGDVITLQDIFGFEKRGVSPEGKVIGRFRATGIRPKFCERLKASGIHLPPDMFEGVTEVR